MNPPPPQRGHRPDDAGRTRLVIEAAEQQAVSRSRRRNGVLATLGLAVLVVAVAIATSGGGGHANAASGAAVAGATYSHNLFAGIPRGFSPTRSCSPL